MVKFPFIKIKIINFIFIINIHLNMLKVKT